ncbi:TIGR00296 family protein [Methanobacterium oryzae]|uniref:TIGR00296 family protein n=1 Tax=Methanobacterium oryzae TaxID=69540 RepID=UPI003D240C83
MVSEEEGKILIRLARKSIESYVKNKSLIDIPEDTPETLKENMGVFTTLNKNGMLRGCIGYPEPIKPLINALVEVAVSAAVNDPRFPPVSESELDDLEIEVSVLTKPELIEVEKPEQYMDKIKIGEDGLIIERGPYRGLLLPQVAVELGWNVEEFLYNTCVKAGLTADCWLFKDVKIYKFSSQIFNE